MLLGKILGEGLQVVGHIPGTMGGSDHQQDGSGLIQYLGQRGWVVDPGLVTRLFQQIGHMIGDIFGGPQHGTDDDIEFCHGMDPDFRERGGKPDSNSKGCG